MSGQPKVSDAEAALTISDSSINISDSRVYGRIDDQGSAAEIDIAIPSSPQRPPGWTPLSRSAGRWRRTSRVKFNPKDASELAARFGGNSPFDDPKQLINDAWEHIENLDGRIKSFLDGKPYAVAIETDRDAGQQVHKLRLTKTMPRKAGSDAKQAITNLREALGHAVYASSVAIYGHNGIRGNTEFPFAPTAAGVHDKLNTELLGVSPEIRTFLEDLQPHETGNPLLWGLNATRNVETHKLIVPLLAATTANYLRIRGRVVGTTMLGLNRWNAAKNETEFLRVGAGSEVKYNLDVAFDVIFGDVAIFGGEPTLSTLYMAAREVQGVVLALESETARIIRNVF